MNMDDIRYISLAIEKSSKKTNNSSPENIEQINDDEKLEKNKINDEKRQKRNKKNNN